MNIPVVRRIQEKNDAAADENRALFARRGVVCLNLLGGAGSGKTALLEAVIPLLRSHMGVAVLEGDLATTRDAERIARLGVPVVQLLTDGGCHLTAVHVHQALTHIDLDRVRLLIIENVGNPICPANFDLGESRRVAVLSVAEGDDKPAKYPLLFQRADLVAISKYDLLPHTAFSMSAVETDLLRLNPHAVVMPISARTGEGIDRLAGWVSGLLGLDWSPARAGRPVSLSAM